MLDLNSIVLHQEGIVFRMVDNLPNDSGQQISGPNSEGILILPERGEIKVVNELGARIWSLIDGRLSIHEIAEHITNEYRVELLVAQKDTLDFLFELHERGLIKIQQ